MSPNFTQTELFALSKKIIISCYERTMDLEEDEKRLDELIQMVWEKRGIYPSLQKVLTYFLKKDCKKITEAIKTVLTKDFDLIKCFELLVEGEIPEALEDNANDIDDLIGVAQFKRHFKAYLKLSLFNLTEYQIKRIITKYHEQITR